MSGGALIIGFLAGVVAGMLGVGGGILFVPGLVLFLNLPQVDAEATPGTTATVSSGPISGTALTTDIKPPETGETGTMAPSSEPTYDLSDWSAKGMS